MEVHSFASFLALPSDTLGVRPLTTSSTDTYPGILRTGASKILRIMEGPQRLDTLPPEIVCQIFGELDLVSALAFAESRRYFARILRFHWKSIFFSNISRDFTPLGPLLQLAGLLQEHEETATRSRESIEYNARFGGGRLATHDASAGRFTFERKHMLTLLHICKVVRQWELSFPRFRFAEAHPEVRRSLNPYEKERLRRALYHWWCYVLFSRDQQYTSVYKRRTILDGSKHDAPLYLSSLSTAELFELRDLALTLEPAVDMELRSLRLAPHRLNVTDGDDERHWIAGLILELAPDDILHYLENGNASYHSLDHLMQTMLLTERRLGVLRGQNLLTKLHSVWMDRSRILMVGEPEQEWEAGQQSDRPCLNLLFPESEGGILDFRDARHEMLRVKYGHDQAQ
ncbi:hypothetical protein DL546_004113 [Coniochaeta pulveracea]|uniref:F-box domain-containing protein n=1 Tax=Coniochaeta pulveracea TaxID=177199 RepID=A0A420Y7U4_9PEZI|nr:hypothetical protein DL546_004113 [Coniochaeta pulveracea]